jgi:hypothetical protein
MADVQAPVVDPSSPTAATEQAVVADDFTRYVQVENARQAGKPIPDAPAASPKTSAAAPNEPVETAPVTEPGSTQETHKGGRKPDAEARIRELTAKIKTLEEQAGKTGVTKPADPPPAETKPADAKKPEAPQPPPELSDFDGTYDEHRKLERKYYEDLAAYQAKLAVAADREERQKAAADAKALEEQNASQAKLNERFEAAKKAHPDFAEVAFSPEVPITDVMDAFIRDSELSGEVLYKLGENGGAEGKRIAALSPTAQARAMVQLELAITPGADKTEKTEPPVKPKTTSAPKPPTQLDGRNAAPADEVRAAVAADDVGAYIRLANARDLKR